MEHIYETERLSLVLSGEDLTDAITEYVKLNRHFLQKTEPKREPEYYTREHQQRLIRLDLQNAQNGTGYRFWITKKQNNKLIGTVTLTNIVKGCFHSCFLGYRLCYDEINKGYMTEALKKLIEIAFYELNLHRVEANIMPENVPSLRVTEKLGFEYEGTSKEYLCIAGEWRTHSHMVLINRDFRS